MIGVTREAGFELAEPINSIGVGSFGPPGRGGLSHHRLTTEPHCAASFLEPPDPAGADPHRARDSAMPTPSRTVHRTIRAAAGVTVDLSQAVGGAATATPPTEGGAAPERSTPGIDFTMNVGDQLDAEYALANVHLLEFGSPTDVLSTATSDLAEECRAMLCRPSQWLARAAVVADLTVTLRTRTTAAAAVQAAIQSGATGNVSVHIVQDGGVQVTASQVVLAYRPERLSSLMSGDDCRPRTCTAWNSAHRQCTECRFPIDHLEVGPNGISSAHGSFTCHLMPSTWAVAVSMTGQADLNPDCRPTSGWLVGSVSIESTDLTAVPVNLGPAPGAPLPRQVSLAGLAASGVVPGAQVGDVSLDLVESSTEANCLGSDGSFPGPGRPAIVTGTLRVTATQPH